ncbi:hypothetical protein N7467_005139 [Penicillium canescens]|nr:hypothetical protein N7467_005139 [Penicillium canescens]
MPGYGDSLSALTTIYYSRDDGLSEIVNKELNKPALLDVSISLSDNALVGRWQICLYCTGKQILCLFALRLNVKGYQSLIRRPYYYGFHNIGGAYPHDSFVRGQPSKWMTPLGVHSVSADALSTGKELNDLSRSVACQKLPVRNHDESAQN